MVKTFSQATTLKRVYISFEQPRNKISRQNALENGDAVSSSSRLKHLSPFIDKNNQLGARGRLSKASLLMTSRYPLILDSNYTAIRLLIQHTHELNCHCGPEQIRNFLMESYWILQCRAVVKQTFRHCRRLIQDVSIPKMADLHRERLPKIPQIVFETTGLDFIWPFPVKNDNKLFSRYVLLFTCLVLRAVHLEVWNNLSTDQTIICIRSFVSRRGKPSNSFQTAENHWFEQPPPVQHRRPKSFKNFCGKFTPYESRKCMEV